MLATWFKNDGSGNLTTQFNPTPQESRFSTMTTADLGSDGDVDLFTCQARRVIERFENLDFTTSLVDGQGSTGEPKVSPNPSAGQVVITSRALSGATDLVQIIDMHGKNVSGLFGYHINMYLYDLRPGIYSVRIIGNNRSSMTTTVLVL